MWYMTGEMSEKYEFEVCMRKCTWKDECCVCEFIYHVIVYDMWHMIFVYERVKDKCLISWCHTYVIVYDMWHMICMYERVCVVCMNWCEWMLYVWMTNIIYVSSLGLSYEILYCIYICVPFENPNLHVWMGMIEKCESGSVVPLIMKCYYYDVHCLCHNQHVTGTCGVLHQYYVLYIIDYMYEYCIILHIDILKIFQKLNLCHKLCQKYFF